ncbi:TrkH family potassium uptake protein [Desulfitobacterium chlororespirans]|uniref:Trk system potassium uptake protein TrkH n=1 Tax=Desulfitobacterium chlororespirans DSM 11544 TaxID=1121395 RepID=A0A1M7UWF4_9FIRM|nr:TrkH family potassium uptake protein [Desulfitobacterium chlororespirans]SHN87299.1 trk system potassium uptake protein TrkH [Desulfitobacterium chlororespirans DSM 11544]
MNYSLVQGIVGRLLMGYALTMFVPLVLAAFKNENSMWAFLLTLLITACLGAAMVYFRKPTQEKMSIRESFVIVGGAWMLTSLLGALPFWLADSVPTFIDALFESVSGLTTTGSSVINDVEALPLSILLWRSITHWLGGIGIIVLFIILLPSTGFGAVHLFNAEVPGPLSKRTMPRIRDTAITIWKIYAFLTMVLITLLMLAGMSPFDAVNHGFSTISAGGFSTKNTSMMHYGNLWIELVVILFITIAGGNFRIYLEIWTKKSLKPLRNTEFITYLAIIIGSTLLIVGGLWLAHDKPPDYAMRHALFQVVSLVTGTGFSSTDYNQWPAVTKLILLALMFIGGCAGSTTGGMKVSRIMLLTKHVWAVLTRGLHPRAVSSIKLDGRPVDAVVVNMVSVFFFLYVGIFALATIIIAGTGLEPFDAMSAVAASLGNVGPGFGIVGPTTTYAGITLFGKFILSLCMLLGRLELFTLLILLRPEFWRTKGGW